MGYDKWLSGGMQDASPLESWGLKKGRINQLKLIVTAFCVLIFIRDITLLKIKGMYRFPSNE